MAKLPGSVSLDGVLPEREPYGLTDTNARAIPSADNAPAEKKHRYQCQKKRHGSRGMKGRKYRRDRKTAEIGLSKWQRPGNDPPEDCYAGSQDDQTLSRVWIAFCEDPPYPETDD